MGEVATEPTVAAARLTEADLSLQEMVRIKSLVRQSTVERRAAERIEREFEAEHAAGLGPQAPIRQALIAWALRRSGKARKLLEASADRPEAQYLLGCIAREAGAHEQALGHLAAAAEKLSDPTPARGMQIDVLLALGRRDEADELLRALEKRARKHPDVCHLRGRVFEANRQLEEALDSYQAALDANGDHVPSAFRMACIFDLYGDDEKAMELYRRCGPDSGSYVGALMNLGLLHDDRDAYEQAMQCFQEVLRMEPNDARAKLFFKNAEASIDMYYDEVQRKEQERLESVLRTPITDFEFSVRSRNCLAKMNIIILDDLIQKTEAEMLSYKNFGETSLREIKEVLETKGLRLGMAREDANKKKRERLRSLSQIGADSEILMRPIIDLDLTVRARKCMSQLDIQTVGDLVTHTEAELMTIKNFGQNSLNEVKQKLTEHNLTLKPMTI